MVMTIMECMINSATPSLIFAMRSQNNSSKRSHIISPRLLAVRRMVLLLYLKQILAPAQLNLSRDARVLNFPQFLHSCSLKHSYCNPFLDSRCVSSQNRHFHGRSIVTKLDEEDNHGVPKTNSIKNFDIQM